MKEKIFLTITILSLLSLTVFVSAIIPNCTDSDGGKEYYIKGETRSPIGYWEDTCTSNYNLQEGTCIENLGVHSYECPFGCSDGACLTEEEKSDIRKWETTVSRGWNIVSPLFNLKDCNSVDKNILCKDDVLVKYWYIPELNKYTQLREDGYNFIKDGFNENEIMIIERSMRSNQVAPAIWIYVDKSADGKRLEFDFSYSTNRDLLSEIFEMEDGASLLREGWNFLSVIPEMVYNNLNQQDPLSLEDIKGNCNIVNAYGWNFKEQQWATILNIIDSKELFTKEKDLRIGKGILVKVSKDCKFGISKEDMINPPIIPN